MIKLLQKQVMYILNDVLCIVSAGCFRIIMLINLSMNLDDKNLNRLTDASCPLTLQLNDQQKENEKLWRAIQNMTASNSVNEQTKFYLSHPPCDEEEG